MKRINKILSTKHLLALLVLYILFFLFLNTAKELFHNHKPDINEPDDCPVLILNQVLNSGISIHFELSNESIVESNIIIPLLFFQPQSNHRTVSLRGPPLV